MTPEVGTSPSAPAVESSATASEPPTARVRPWIRQLAFGVGGLFTLGTILWTGRALANVLVQRTVEVDAVVEEEIRKVVVHVSGHVRVSGTDRRGATMTGRLMSGIKDGEFDWEVHSGVLEVTMTCPTGLVTCDQELDLEIPRRAKVDVHARSVEARSLRGMVQLQTGNGDTRLDNIAGPLSVHQTTGRITGTRVTSLGATFELDAGVVDVSFTAVPASVAVRVGAGAASIELPPEGAPYNVNASANGGASTVLVPHDPLSPHSVAVRAGVGDVEIRYTF